MLQLPIRDRSVIWSILIFLFRVFTLIFAQQQIIGYYDILVDNRSGHALKGQQHIAQGSALGSIVHLICSP